jgi:uncharacterized membrane protein YdjX (TVP38/TMEM64 family)
MGAVALVVATLVVAYQLGAFSRLSEPRALAQSLLATGVYGYVGFVVAYAVLQPFGVPGTVFIVAAPLVWPWKTAFALSMTGTMAASVVGFVFARFVARDWVAARIPARFQRYDRSLQTNAFWTVFLLRLVFWMPQVLHFFFGVSKVRFSTHFWGSLLGYAPPLFVVSYFGSEMFDASGTMQPRAWPIMGAMLLASLVITAAVRVVEKRRLGTSG